MNMKKMIGALTAKFAVALMAFGLAGGAWADYVAQIGDTKYESLAEAVAAAQEGNTVTLLADTSVADTITINKSMTLDLNGKTITNTSTGKRPFYVVTEDPSAVVMTEDEDGNVVFEGATTLTVEGNGGSLVIPDGGTAYGFFDIAGGYTGIIINGGTISGDGGNGSLIRYGVDTGHAQQIALNNVTGITKSRFVAYANAYYLWDISVVGGTYTHSNYRNDNSGYLKNAFQFYTQNGIFDGVTITSDEGSCVCCGGSYQENMVFRNNTFTVNGKSIISDPWNNAAIAVQSAGSLTIESGTYTSAGIYGVATANSGATINIEGGTITGADYGIRIYGGGYDPDTTLNISGTASVTGGQAGVYVLEIGEGNGTATANVSGGSIAGGITIENQTAVPSRATVNIEDGEISGTLTDASPSGKSGVYSVSGGVFSSQVPAGYCTADYSPITNTDPETREAYPYTVVSDYEAQIVREGVVQQKGALAAAFAVAANGDTIELLTDVVLESQIAHNPNSGSFVLDGNGHTISQVPNANFNGHGAIDIGTSGGGSSATIAAMHYTITNVTFSGFNSEIIRCEGAALTLDGCSFTDNNITVDSGRGKHLVRIAYSTATIQNCVFKDNTAGGYGVIYIDEPNNNILVRNCLFKDNVVDGTAVIDVAHCESMSIVDSTFEHNTLNSSNNGAVVYLGAKDGQGDNGGDCTGCLFKDNVVNYTTTSGNDDRIRAAGAIFTWAYGINPGTISGNAFVNNSVVKQSANVLSCYAKSIFSGGKYNAQDLAGNYFGGSAPKITQNNIASSGNDIYAELSTHAVTASTYAESYTLNDNNYGVTVTLAQQDYTVTFLLRDNVGDMAISYDNQIYTMYTQDGVERSGAAVYNYMTQTVASGDPATEPTGEPSYWYHSGKTFPAGNNTGIPFTVDDSLAYVFDGWRLSGENVRYDFSTPVTSDITLVPHFSAVEAVFEIYTEADLFAFAREVALGRSYRSKVGGAPRQTVKLMNNITLTSNWTPIPGKFHGIFDGNGYAISGLVINDTNEETGFFRTSGKSGNSFVIKDLTFQNPQVTSSGSYVGVVVGQADCVAITNVTVNNPAVLSTSTDNVGGLVGSVNNNITTDPAYVSTFSGCSVNGGTISCTGSDGRMVGGLMGQGLRYLTITDCTVSNVTINGYRKLGGIIGQANEAYLTCTDASVSNVTLSALGDASYANHLTMGGLVGQFATPVQSTITGTVSDLTMNGPESIASGKNYIMGLVSGGTAGTVEAAETAMSAANMTFDVTVSGTNRTTINTESSYAGINGNPSVTYVASITRGEVTTEYTSAQEALDQVVSGDTLTLYAGDHGTLYIRQNPDISVIVDVVGKDGDGEGAPRGNDRYRAFENVTIVGESGATLNKIVVESGTNSSANPSSNPDYTNLDSLIEIDNLTISGLIFNLQANGPAIDLGQTYHFRLTGLTIDGCTVNGTESFGDSERLLYGVIASNPRVSQNRPQFTAVEKTDVNYTTGLSGLVVRNCTFNNLHQVMEVRNVTNLTFTGNTVNGVRKQTIIAVSDTHNPVALKGTVTIANNTIDGTSGDRVFRMDKANATVAITGNTITDYSASDADFIKISTSGNDASYTITGNTITGTTGGLCVNCDKEPGSTDLVAKIGTKYYKTLADAIAAVPTTGAETTVAMVNNSSGEANVIIAATKNVVLELNGKTVSATAAGGEWHLIVNRGVLTVQDSVGGGAITADGSCSSELSVIYNIGGTLNLVSGTISYTGNWYIGYAVCNSSNAWGVNDDKVAVFNMTGGTISAPSGDAALRVYQNCAAVLDPVSTNHVNITGGTVDNNGIFVDTYLYQSGSTLPEGVYDGSNIDVSINISGDVVFRGLIDLKIRHTYNTKLNIAGGTFENFKLGIRRYEPEWSSAIQYPAYPLVDISGGAFTFKTGSDARIFSSWKLFANYTTEDWADYRDAFKVTGGVFNVDLNDYDTIVFNEGETGVANTDPETVTAYPYTVGVAVVPVAQIGDNKYESLAEAIAAVPTDGTATTITMIANEAIDIAGNALEIAVGKNVVLDLNGHQVVGFCSTGENSALILNNGTLTVVDSTDLDADGTGDGKLMYSASPSWNWSGVDGDYSGSYASNLISNNGTVRVESGFLEVTNPAGKIVSASYVIDSASGGTVVITGGKLSSSCCDVIRMRVSNSAESELNISGGSVVALPPSDRAIWLQKYSNNAKSTVNVSGGLISGSMYSIQDDSSGSYTKDTITGGTFDGFIYTTAELDISGGAFNGGYGGSTVYSVMAYGSKASISGGVFYGFAAFYSGASSLDWSVTGGAFSYGGPYQYSNYTSEKFVRGGIYDDVPRYLAPGYLVVDNTDTETQVAYPYAVVPAVASITADDETVYYATFEGAIDDAELDDSIVITVIGYNAETMVAPDGWKFVTEGNVTTLVRKVYVAQIVKNEGATTNKYESLLDAYSHSVSGDTIEMIADDWLSEELAINRSVTITGAVDEDGKPLYTIYGNPTDNYDVDVFIKNASSAIDVTIQNVNIREFGHQYASGSQNGALYVSRSTHTDTHVLVSNVTISAYNNYAIIAPQGHLEVVDCAIDGYKDAAYGALCTGGIWSGDMFDDLPSSTVLVKRTAIVNLDSNKSGTTAYAIDARAGSTVVVEDCTITNVRDGIASVAAQESGNGGTSVNVSGTTVEAARNALAISGNPTYLGGSVIAELNVSSGTFVGAVVLPQQYEYYGIIAISGGYFSQYIVKDFCDSGYLCTTKPVANGMYQVVPAATVTYTLAGDGDPTGAALPSPASFAYPSGDLAEIALAVATCTSSDYTFAGWKIGGTGDAIAVLPSGTAGNVTLVATWTVAQTIEVITTNEQSTVAIKVTEDWIAANVTNKEDSAESPTVTDIQEALNETADNGLKVWENYVIGQDPSTAVAVGAEQGAEITAMPVSNTLSVQPVDTGFTVEYSLKQVDTNGTTVATIETKPTTDFDIDLSKVSSNAYYVMTATIKTDAGAMVSTVTSTNVIGVLKVESAATTTAVAVPWASYDGTNDISVADIVRTANLTEGDSLKAYDPDSKTYKEWTLGADKTWQPSSTISTSGNESAGNADAYKVARGSAVWLTRTDPSQPIYLVGGAASGTVETKLEAAPSDTKSSWNLVGNPTVEPVDVKDLLGAKTGDQVIVPTAGAPKNYVYVEGKGWGYYKTVPYEIDGVKVGVVSVFTTVDTDVPAGTGFWYLNSSTSKDAKINW